MIRTPSVLSLVVLVLSLTVLPIGTRGELQAQASGTGHEHLTEVACVDTPPGEKRPEFGCFNIGTVTELQFRETAVYWHLYSFGSRKAAEAAKSATGIVAEEDGRVWLSEFGARDTAPRGGEAVAVVGPLQLPVAKSYSAVLSYAVMRPGDSSRVHTHPGPEGWYVLAGEQCLETPAGANRAGPGQTMTVPPNVPMELNVTGKALRRAFALVIHDSTQQRGIPSDWKPSEKCGAAQSTSPSEDPIPASEVKYRHPVLETSRFIAYLLEIPPHHATLMHRHDRDILSVFVSGAKTTSTFQGRKPVTDAIPSGESRFRAAGFTHATRNDDSVVFRSVILEFAQPQGAVRAESAEQRYCNEGSPAACVTEKQQLCTEGFCVTEIRMAPGAIRKAPARAASYAMIPVNNCELSVGALDRASVHAYHVGDIQYFESASTSWKNAGQAEAHVVLVNFR